MVILYLATVKIRWNICFKKEKKEFLRLRHEVDAFPSQNLAVKLIK